MKAFPWRLASPTLHGYFDATWAAVALFAYALAWTSGVVSAALIAPLAFFSVFTFLAKETVLRVPRLTIMVGIILYQAVNGVMSLLDEADFAETFGAMFVILLTAALMGRKRLMGHWACYGLALLIGIGAVVVKGEAPEYVLFIALALALMVNMNAAFLLFSVQGRRDVRERLTPAYFLQLLSSLPAGLALAMLVFAAFPRISSLGIGFSFESKRGRTGYSGAITLSGGGRIQESQAVVMRVVADEASWLERRAEDLYFRGNAVDRFTGDAWIAARPPRTVNAFGLDLRTNLAHSLATRKLDVFYEPTSVRQLFYPGVLREISPSPSLWRVLRADPARGEILLGDDPPPRVQLGMTVSESRPLLAESDLTLAEIAAAVDRMAPAAGDTDSRRDDGAEALSGPNPTPPAFEAPWRPDAEALAVARELPAAVRGAPYFRAFADSFAHRSPDSRLSALLRELTTRFQSDFTASLINDFSGHDSLEEFLAKTRRGHCEYFATATALLLRDAGVPARVVLGYRGGRFNDQAQALEVRELNAHAWVEVFLPRQGWFPFDAMPYLAPAARRGDWLEYAADVMNATTFWFNRYVVDYNIGTQAELVRKVKEQGRPWEWKLSPTALPWPFLAGGGALIALGWWARRRWRRGPRDPQGALPAYYRAFLRAVARLAPPRAPGETFRAYHARLRRDVTPEDVVQRVDAALEADLYARAPSTDAPAEAEAARVRRRA